MEKLKCHDQNNKKNQRCGILVMFIFVFRRDPAKLSQMRNLRKIVTSKMARAKNFGKILKFVFAGWQ